MSEANETSVANNQKSIDVIAQKTIEEYLALEPSILDKIELCKLRAVVINTIQQYLKNPAKMIPDDQTIAVYNYLRKKLIIEIINSYCYGDHGRKPDFPKDLVEEAASILIDIEDGLIMVDDYDEYIGDALREALRQERKQNE